MVDPLPLMHCLAQLARRSTARELEAATRAPAKAQQARLRAILTANADTEYGRRHAFAQSIDARTFARHVPLMTTDDLEPLVRRSMSGERNVLTAESPIAYVATRGPRAPRGGQPKYVPVTESSAREYQRATQAAMHHLYRRFPSAFRGNLLSFTGASARLPALLRAVNPWPVELLAIENVTARSFLSWALALASRTSIFLGSSPASIVGFLESFDANAGLLAYTFRTGRLPNAIATTLSADERAFFAPRIEQSTELRHRVERAAAVHPVDRRAYLFPDLELVSCWMSGAAGAFIPTLEAHLGEVPIRDAIYATGKGAFNVPLGDDEPGGTIALTSHFYEFIEEEHFENGGCTSVLAHELEDGRRYVVVVTTSGGLYRYVTNDIVDVRGFHRNTPRIVFAHKALAAEEVAQHSSTRCRNEGLRSIDVRLPKAS